MKFPICYYMSKEPRGLQCVFKVESKLFSQQKSYNWFYFRYKEATGYV